MNSKIYGMKRINEEMEKLIDSLRQPKKVNEEIFKRFSSKTLKEISDTLGHKNQ